jgi:hypothetical protein
MVRACRADADGRDLLLLWDYMAPYPRELSSWYMSLWQPEISQEFPAFCGTWRIITRFSWAQYGPLSWMWWIQSTFPYLTSFTLILNNPYIYTCLLSSSFPLSFLTRILYTFLISPVCATCPQTSHLLDLSNLGFKFGFRSLDFEMCPFVC